MQFSKMTNALPFLFNPFLGKGGRVLQGCRITPKAVQGPASITK